MADRPVRILILVENLPVPLDRRVWQESCALRDAGYEVTVICPRMRGCHAPEESLDGIRIYRHWISGEAGGFVGFFAEYLTALWGEFRLAWRVWWRHGIDVIHLCNPPDLLFLVALPFRVFGGVRVIYDVHDAWPEMYEAKFGRRGVGYWMVRWAERMTYATAHGVLATNASVREIATSRGGQDEANVYVVRTAPQVRAAGWRRDSALKRGRRFLVGYVGVMGNADGVHLVVEAARYLIREAGREDVQFLLMGTGPEYDRLVAMRDGYGLEGYVDLPGRVSNEFLFTALKTMDLGVSSDPINPYNHHCTMNKVLEYMAFGKPQVMFDLKEGRASAGAAAVYVKESAGEALGAAIRSLLDDPEQRERMGRIGARRLRQQLGWERSVDQLHKAYRNVLNQ